MARTDMNNGMDEVVTSGFDMGFYPSFLDENSRKFGLENADSYGFSEEQSCHGLFTELGFSDEIQVPKWSLMEQLASTTCMDSPSLEDIVDEACSPLSVSSMDASLLNESSVPSPLSDSGVSCSSPYSTEDCEEIESGVWPANQLAETLDWSSFQIFTDNYKEQEVQGTVEQNEGQDWAPVQEDITEIFLNNTHAAEDTPVLQEVETFHVINKEAALPIADVVVESVNRISPAPEAGGKILLIKAVSVRPAPYLKSRTGRRQKTKEQKERKKNQNRDAALRYRNKRKDELQCLFDEASVLEESNQGLSEKVTGLKKEIDYLKTLMLDVIKARLAQNKTT